MLARMLVFSEARFQFRQLQNGRPGQLFGTQDLQILEVPWPNGTTGDLLARAIQDVDLEGNFYAYREGGKLHRMRPDWVTIVLGSRTNDAEAGFQADAEVAGYLYHPGGRQRSRDPVAFLPEQVAHWAPLPDPEAQFPRHVVVLAGPRRDHGGSAPRRGINGSSSTMVRRRTSS